MPVSIVKKHSVGLLLPLLLVFSRVALAQPSDLDTQLMLTTVKVSDTDSSGTAFILSRPKPGDPKATRFRRSRPKTRSAGPGPTRSRSSPARSRPMAATKK